MPTLSADFVFLWRDAGETLALEPVIQQLIAQQYTCTAIVTGYGTCPYNDNTPLPPYVTTLYRMGVPLSSLEPLANRSSRLPEDDVKLLTEHVHGTVLVTGMVSAVQLQLSLALASKQTIGYDDGFAAWNESTWPAAFTQVPAIDALYVTASMIAANASRLHPKLSVATVGSPTLEAWVADTSNHTRLQQVREQVFGNIQVPILAYYGGYGAGYNASVELYARLISSLLETEEVHGAFLRHPGNFTDAVEQQIFQDYGVAAHITMVDRRYATADIAAITNVSLSQGSTVCVQALFIGKPSLFLSAPGDDSSNIATQLGLLPDAHTLQEGLEQYKLFKHTDFLFDRSRLDASGIPRNASQHITSRLIKLLGPL